MIRVKEIRKSFAGLQALDSVSFAVERGTITVFTGADGAGKSTLFKILVGLVRRDSGSVFLNGTEIIEDFSVLTSIAGYMPERFSLYTDLTVDENLDFFANVYHVPAAKREELKNRLLGKTGMAAFKDRRAGALSGGMKQKLALSTILLSSPDLIILDEPTTGVDPLSRIEFFQILQDMKAEGKTVILSTPYLDEAEKGDTIIMMKNGRIMVQDSVSRLKANFPARLFRITPRGNIFETVEKMGQIEEIKNNIYIRGRYIKYLQREGQDFLSLIPARQVEEESPTLEDIYIYYERYPA